MPGRPFAVGGPSKKTNGSAPRRAASVCANSCSSRQRSSSCCSRASAERSAGTVAKRELTSAAVMASARTRSSLVGSSGRGGRHGGVLSTADGRRRDRGERGQHLLLRRRDLGELPLGHLAELRQVGAPRALELLEPPLESAHLRPCG